MKIHFIGIGGAGTAPLAKIMLERSAEVSGSDREDSQKMNELRTAGATVHVGHQAEYLPEDIECVVYSSAVADDNPELAKAHTLGIHTVKRGAFLGELTGNYRRLIAVSGSHGKTSVTAMLAWIFHQYAPGAGWLIGGEVHGFPAARAGDGDLFVTEVDESDGTHTLVSPWCGVVPNVDDDHSWSVGGEAQLTANFRAFGEHSRHLLYVSSPRADAVYHDLPQAECADLTAKNLPSSLAGFQRLNGALAALAARKAGIADADIMHALATFPGVERRLTLRYQSENHRIIEDYAHHPAEVAQSLATFRELYPHHHLRVVFQPHRFARLEKYFDRLAEELRQADSVIITPVFAAWSDTGKVDGRDLAQAIGPKAIYHNGGWEEIAAHLRRHPPLEPTITAVIGAGDLNHLFKYLPW